MTAVNQDFEMFAGDSLLITVPVVDGAGVAKPITGATITWVIWSGSVRLTKRTGGNGITITDGPGGIFTILLEPADTALLPAGDYEHEAQVVDVTLKSSTVLEGIVTLYASHAA